MRRKGISPVIATVIIVAVAIAIAIAVAFWMTGIVGLFTNFEQVQIQSAYATGSAATGFTIKLTVNNTGTAQAVIDNIFINNFPYSQIGVTVTPTPPITLAPGTGAEITITIPPGTTLPNGGKLTDGSSVEVKIHTASGKEYPKLIVLP